MDQRAIGEYAFRQYLQEGKLMGSRCAACGAQFVPPRDLCGACRDGTMEWVAMSGLGTLAAFTSIAIGTPATVAEGYHRDNPYCCAVVALEEGPRVVGRLSGVAARQPETIHVGLAVRAVLEPREDAAEGPTALVFQPR